MSLKPILSADIIVLYTCQHSHGIYAMYVHSSLFVMTVWASEIYEAIQTYVPPYCVDPAYILGAGKLNENIN